MAPSTRWRIFGRIHHAHGGTNHMVQPGGVQGWHALNCADAEVFVLEDVVRTRGFAKFLLLQAESAL